MITFIADIPQRENGKYPASAREEMLRKDDVGRWFIDVGGEFVELPEAEVIDICRTARNWERIKAAHFAG